MAENASDNSDHIIINGSIKHAHGSNYDDTEPPDKRKKVWSVHASEESKGAINNIRLCEELHFKEAMEKRDTKMELIKLSIG